MCVRQPLLCVCERACTNVCVCVSDVDGAGVGVAEGGSAALRCGTLGEDPLLLPLHRTHLGQPEGPLEDHAQAQAGVTHTHLFYHVLHSCSSNCFKSFVFLIKRLFCSCSAAVLILVHSQISAVRKSKSTHLCLFIIFYNNYFSFGYTFKPCQPVIINHNQ